MRKEAYCGAGTLSLKLRTSASLLAFFFTSPSCRRRRLTEKARNSRSDQRGQGKTGLKCHGHHKHASVDL